MTLVVQHDISPFHAKTHQTAKAEGAACDQRIIGGISSEKPYIKNQRPMANGCHDLTNPFYHMTTLELVLNMLAEATTTEISKQKAPGTFSENIDVARAGGKVAGDARKAIESQTGVPVITSKNAAQLHQVVTDLLEGATTSPKKQGKKR